MKRMLFAYLILPIACATRPSNVASETTPKGDPKVFKAPSVTDSAPFVAHNDAAPMQSYLALNLPYAPFQKLLEQVETAEGVSLKNRGDAHITVVTPVEYEKVLKKRLPMAEINKIAEEAKIQETPWTPICIGKAQKEIGGKTESTYFVVVESPALIDLRGKIEEAYIKNGGKAQHFVPEKYAPHITLGFTSRDLHAEDGARKRQESCVYRFQP